MRGSGPRVLGLVHRRRRPGRSPSPSVPRDGAGCGHAELAPRHMLRGLSVGNPRIFSELTPSTKSGTRLASL
ncbi:protein of unknown function (plasmid) [Azospirillum baldaniorum]|uniref:Uncharacterized protein n=1 Tax=Azospirillum baldaniorum TaxID=1064539 RepID=A0A9P1NR58_9PROT|nr:protein of unknown function [Azospirillum baldaniorum]